MMDLLKQLIKQKPYLIGLLQAIAVVIYVAKVAAFLFLIEQTTTEPGYLGIVLMLVLFVFSAAITATLVFGIPVYFLLRNKIKESIYVLGFTLAWSFLIIISAIFAIFLFP